MGPHLDWRVRALGISQAFLQSVNLRPEDRNIATPPTMATLPWGGRLPPTNMDLETLAPSQNGSLLRRPLIGGSDAPMRLRETL